MSAVFPILWFMTAGCHLLADGEISEVCEDMAGGCDDTPGSTGNPHDEDGDGFSGTAGDCNDGDPAIHPDATEDCSTEADDNCDGSTNDPGATGCVAHYIDADADGWGSDEELCLCEPDGDHQATQAGDCDDGDSGTHPYADERCDDSDADCDGEVYENNVVSIDQTAFDSIQAAIDAASPSAMVSICPGSWQENLVIGSSVFLNAPQGASATVLTGLGTESVIQTTADTVEIAGLSIIGGIGSLNPSGSSSFRYGGGLLVASGQVTVTDCVIEGNTASKGGAVAVLEGNDLIIENTTISRNDATSDGGALYLKGQTTLDSVSISNNLAGNKGGAIYVSAATLSIDSSSITNQQGHSGGGLYVDEDASVIFTSSEVKYNYAKLWGGGVRLKYGEVTSLDSDWGDNSPEDLQVGNDFPVSDASGDFDFICTATVEETGSCIQF